MPGQHCSGGVPVIKVKDVMAGRISEADLLLTHPTIDAAYKRSRLAVGDVLITIRGTTGRVALVPSSLTGANITQDTARVRVGPSVSQDFLYHALQASSAQHQISLHTIGQAVKGINIRDVKRVAVPFPTSLSEQLAITTALNDVDALLAGLDRLIGKKRDLKHAAMQQILTGQTRLPGFRGEWEVKRLGDLGIFLKGRGVKKDEAKSGDLPCVRYGEIYTHHTDYIRSFNSWISPEVAATATRLKLGDLLFAGSGETKEEIGKCVAFTYDCDAFAGGDIVILRLAGVQPMFMGYYCNTAPVNAQKASKGQGDAVVHISAAALSSIEVPLPSYAEQTAIGTVLSDMDAELSALEARRNKTRDLKQAMMQELFTGRTRLL